MTSRSISLRFFRSLFLLLAGCFALFPLRADDFVPPDSAMGKAKDGHLALIDVLNSGDVGTDVYHLKSVVLSDADGDAKVGDTSLKVEAEGLNDGGAKGTLVSPRTAPKDSSMIGFWAKVDEGANVSSIGLEVVDAEGEILLADVPAVQNGKWTWMEFPLDATFKPSYPQPSKNGVLDLPLKEVRIIWFTEKTGMSRLAVNGLIAFVKGEDKGPPLEARMTTTGFWPADKPISASTLLVNRTAQQQTVNLHFRVLTDSTMSAPPPPDPVYGPDRALGMPSQTLVNGQVVEKGSLTDNDDSTNFRIEDKKAGPEVIQEIDLGKTGPVVALRYLIGDANWAFKLDVSKSDDGATYTPVEGLQGVDLYKKWNYQTLANFPPFQARYLRFRYHKDGDIPASFQMPSTLEVLGGLEGETWEPPATGPVIDDTTVTATVPANSFTIATYQTKTPPGPGCYVLSMIGHGGGLKTGSYVEGFVLPVPLAKPIAHSRVGVNSDTDAYVDKMELLGIGWMRYENMKWPKMQVKNPPGELRFDGTSDDRMPFDRIFNSYHDHHLQALPYLWHFPKEISTAPESATRFQFNLPKKNSDYGDFCFQIAARYGSTKHPPAELMSNDKLSGLNLINTFELWNEPDLNNPDWGSWMGTFDQYLEMFRVGAEGIKRADPNAKVSNAGLASMALTTVDQLESYHYADGKRPVDFMDLLNVHHYTGKIPPEIARIDTNVQRGPDAKAGPLFEENLFDLDAWRRTYLPGKEIWLTETGYDIGGPRATSTLHQTAWLPRDLMVIFSGGIDRVYIFRETGSGDDQWTGCGVLKDDGGYRPDFFTVATMIREIDGFDDVMRISPIDSNVWQVIFRKNGEYVLAAWAVEGKGKLGLDLGAGTVTDSFGRRQAKTIGPDFELGIFPNYFHSVGAQRQLGNLFDQAKTAREARFVAQKK